MNHRANPKFWALYNKLPQEIRQTAARAFERLKQDELHPSLHLKQVGRFWSVRVGSDYRALAVREQDVLIWFWIGPHAEYDQLIG